MPVDAFISRLDLLAPLGVRKIDRLRCEKYFFV